MRLREASNIRLVEDRSKAEASLTGFVDAFRGGDTLFGWVLKPSDLHAKIAIDIARAGLDVTEIECGLQRADLAAHADGRFGFRIRLAHPLSALKLLAGMVEVVARGQGDVPFTLPLEQRLRASLLIEALGDLQQQLTNCREHEMEVGADLAINAALPSVPPAFAWLTALRHRRPRPTDVEALAPLWLPIGLRSGCGTAELGPGGNLFLTGGTSRVSDRYQQPHEEADAIASCWLDLFRRRALALARRRIHYVQIIVPEKQSLIPSHIGDAIPSPTPLLDRIERMIADDPMIRSRYVSARACFCRAEPHRVFRRIDTHLSPYGSRILYGALAPVIGHGARDARIGGVERVASGDLSKRFLGIDTLERVEDMAEEECVGERILVDQHPSDVGHIGRWYRWHNPGAPAGPRVLAFGNSFMDGASAQESLSYWLAGNCRDYEFRFSPSFLEEAIDEFRPDIVIGQTIERYLSRVPAA